MAEMADMSLRNPTILIEIKDPANLVDQCNKICINLYKNNEKIYTVLFSIFIQIEAHLGANYGRNDRYKFEKFYYSHRKSRVQSIFLTNINKLYLYMFMNTMKKVYFIIFNTYENRSTFRCQLWQKLQIQV